MTAIHISEAEAVHDFAGVLAKLDAGSEIVIDKETRPPVILQPALEVRRRVSEVLRMAEERDLRTTLDPTFSENLRAAIDSHPEPLHNPWDWHPGSDSDQSKSDE